MAARGCGHGADGSGDPPLLPLTEQMADVALLVVGMLLGALAFSQIVGRHRARRLAELADQLAHTTDAPDGQGTVKLPDRVLSNSPLFPGNARSRCPRPVHQRSRLLDAAGCGAA